MFGIGIQLTYIVVHLEHFYSEELNSAYRKPVSSYLLQQGAGARIITGKGYDPKLQN